jgi:penicillin amidase
MKTFKKILAVLAIFVLLAIVVAFFFVRHISRKALPDYNKSLVLTGLIDEVEVYRDNLAIPYIIAQNEHDLYLTTGYVMAQDRLWQMDFLRRVTQGRLAEIFGEDMIENDLFLRALRMPEKARWVLENSDPEIIAAINAFASGVNLFITQNQNKLPLEFTILGYKPEPWEPIHSASLIGYMAWDLSGSWSAESTMHKLKQVLDEEKFLQLVPNFDFHPTPVHVPSSVAETEALFSLLQGAKNLRDMGIEVFSASNNWAVSGEKSITGKPILANDMHLGFGSPGIWYQMHQEVKGKLKVSGVVLPGQPLVVVGHNQHIAWGMTNVSVDDADFFFETINPDNKGMYLFNDEWRDLEIRKEIIKVKGGTEQERELRFTHRGPILSDLRNVGDQAISMLWSGNQTSNEVRSIYLLNRAKNWDDFRDALTTMTSVSQNVIYADVEGNIGLQTATGIPIREHGGGYFIKPGDTDKYDWKGFVPFDELPFSYNPPEGHLSSANNKTTGPDYPYNIGYQFATPHRIDRIREMLNSKPKIGVDDFKEMLADFKSKKVDQYLPGIIEVLDVQQGFSANEAKALEMLKNWNGVLDANSGAAAVFEKFFIKFYRNLLHDELGDGLFNDLLGNRSTVLNILEHVWTDRQSSWINNVNTTEVETFDDLVADSFRQTVEWLEQNINKDASKWQWGKIHQITISHPMGSVKILDKIFKLNRGPYEAGGSWHTVSPLAYSYRKPFEVVHGASQRHIFQPNNWAENFVVIPTGISGIPASKYYLDQTKMFLNNQYHTLLWESDEIKSRAKYNAVFSPEE